jgi:serine/threonine protein kinase
VDRIVADVCRGLQFAHGLNIVHADLKPANVFITTSGLVKLIDFNMAYPLGRAPKTDEEDTVEILGRLGGVTPLYASPQRLSGAEPSEGDDIFSLAVLAHIALTGVRPFGELNALEAKEKGVGAKICAPLPAGRRAALQRALALDDRERTRSIAQFIDDYSSLNLGAWVAGFFRERLRR